MEEVTKSQEEVKAEKKALKAQKKKAEKAEEARLRALEKERDKVYEETIKYEKEHKKEEKVAPEGTFISLQNINKIYANHVQAVFDFNLDIKEKEFIVFVGPSGCGKSTTLRMIAGLETITSGDLYIDGVYSNDLEPKDRDVSMVFQSYALYPHMTVYQNMAFGLKVRHLPKTEIDERIHKAARILEIEEYLDRKPRALSGGQCQRVALGRAIVRNSKVFLMDEPLSNLDAKLRVQMRSEIVNLHNELGATTIYVTHDQTEAMTMATRIVVMKKGYIQQIGTPKEIYNHPSNIFVATFIGSPAMNVINATYNDGVIEFADGEKVKLTPEIVKTHDDYYKAKAKEATEVSDKAKYESYIKASHPIVFGIRPEDIAIHNASATGFSDPFDITITVAELLGNEYHIHAKLAGNQIVAKIIGQDEFKANQKVKVAFNLTRLHLFDVDSTECIY